jgi:hypothetical protein
LSDADNVTGDLVQAGRIVTAEWPLCSANWRFRDILSAKIKSRAIDPASRRSGITV